MYYHIWKHASKHMVVPLYTQSLLNPGAKINVIEDHELAMTT
jgi:hypothetical protein